MKFELKIESGNDAFTDADSEVARILRVTASVVACQGMFRGEGPLMDINGTKVGAWTMTED